MYDITSKTIDGITDLVVVAPIREGFISAYENITYATRLKLVAEALNRVRVAAREHERVTPFSDVTERILTLLDFRVGIIDKDLFALDAKQGRDGVLSGYDDPTDAKAKQQLESRRYLYLTATFDGAWEPYMRLIWDPLGPFLDLLFCNCEDYVTASDHSFAEYIQWVRDNQMDSSIFYATTGLTVRDHLYLSKLERLQRAGSTPLELAESIMPDPEADAAATRAKFPLKTLQLGLEALTVLYKLADYFPPQWMTGDRGALGNMQDGHRLVIVARELLRGWDAMIKAMETILAMLPDNDPRKQRWMMAKSIYAEPLKWYATGIAEIDRLKAEQITARRPDPRFERSEIQGGILSVAGRPETPVQHGALLLFTIRNGKASRAFLKGQSWHFAAGEGANGDNGVYKTLALTPHGMLRLGVSPNVVDRFPYEFREGLMARSGQVGDMRENHPRNWILPERNGPEFIGAVPAGTRLPPVDLDEVDFVIQLRSTNTDRSPLEAAVRALAAAAAPGATLESVEWMEGSYDPQTGRFRDHFGFADGISQPKPILPVGENGPAPGDKDGVALGEIILGYANEHGDCAPGPFEKEANWRARFRKFAQRLQLNGTFLVVRKIGEEVEAFEKWLAEQSNLINAKHRLLSPMTPDRLKALMLGRNADGTPLLPTMGGGDNDFDYTKDTNGHGCPFASHVRRANPRRDEFGRKTPRLLRRGLRFTQGPDNAPRRGLMFLAYNASIAEQYEVIQRWLNGGNSTGVASAHNDPLTGVLPKEEAGVFRFVLQGQDGLIPVQIELPRVASPIPGVDASEPGRHPFTPLYWGLYLFVPSRSTIALLATLPETANATTKGKKDSPLKGMATRSGEYEVLRDPLEQAVGWKIMSRLESLPPAVRAFEWKRLIEDYDAKDPALRDLTPSVWAAIRHICGGVKNLRERDGTPTPVKAVPPMLAELGGQVPPEHDWNEPPDRDAQNVILCAGSRQVFHVLSDWANFSTEEQLRRIAPNSGPIFVTQQPDNEYKNAQLNAASYDYPSDARATNAILMGYGSDYEGGPYDGPGSASEMAAFREGYESGADVLKRAKEAAEALARLTAAEAIARAQEAAAEAIGKGDDPAVANARAQMVIDAATAAAKQPFFKLELRRQYLLPALGGLCARWYGLPDDKHMLAKGWGWEAIVAAGTDPLSDTPGGLTRTKAHCPGDFLSPSRNAFYPRPGPEVTDFAHSHGSAILAAAEAFVAEHRKAQGPPTGSVARKMFAAIADDTVLARNLIGTMVGAIPPMDGNLRGILAEWLGERTLWRHQGALRGVMGGELSISDFAKARSVLYGPISQAMCKRPAPDLLYRTTKGETVIPAHEQAKKGAASGKTAAKDVRTQERDLVIVSLVSASQRSLMKAEHGGIGDVSIVFGGNRKAPDQGYRLEGGVAVPIDDAAKRMPVHACPAQDMAMGAIMGIMAALLDAGTIVAQPASLIVKVSDW